MALGTRWKGQPSLLQAKLACFGHSLLHVVAGEKCPANEARFGNVCCYHHPPPSLGLCPPTLLIVLCPGLSSDCPLPGWRPSPCCGHGRCAWGCGSSVSPTQTNCFPGTWWIRHPDKISTSRAQSSHSPSNNCSSPAPSPANTPRLDWLFPNVCFSAPAPAPPSSTT